MHTSNLHFLFRKMSTQFICHFLIGLFLFLSCVNGLYMLGINPLSVISLVNIFSLSVDFFVLSLVSSAAQKRLSIIRSHLFIFAFFPFTLEHKSEFFKNILL